MAATAPANAESINHWSFQDDNIDFLLRPDASSSTGYDLINPATCSGAACNITLNDVLVSVFDFTTYTKNGINAVPPGGEIVGVAAIQYTGNGTNPITGDPAREYSPVPTGLDSILGMGTGTTTVPNSADAMVAIFTGTAGQLDIANNSPTASCTSLAACITAGSTGSLLQVDGLTGTNPSDFWVSGTGGTNINLVWNVTATQQVAATNFGLDNIYFAPAMPVCYQNLGAPAGVNPAGCNVISPGFVQVIGSATNGGGVGQSQLTNGAFSYGTTITLDKYSVPEPATLVLMGLGLFGMAGFQRRKS